MDARKIKMVGVKNLDVAKLIAQAQLVVGLELVAMTAPAETPEGERQRRDHFPANRPLRSQAASATAKNFLSNRTRSRTQGSASMARATLSAATWNISV